MCKKNIFIYFSLIILLTACFKSAPSKEELTKRAEQGDVVAQYELSKAYYTGKFGVYDKENALKWGIKAGDQGDPTALLFVSIILYDEHKEKNKKKIEEFQEKGFQSFPLILEKANKGDEYAQLFAGCYYLTKKYAHKDVQKAIEFLKKSSDQGNKYAQYELGRIYIDDENHKNYQQALILLKKSANQNFCSAQTKLGEIYEKGYGVNVDYEQAFYWYELAAKQNAAQALFRLSKMYEEGLGREKDPELAAKYLNQAAIQNSVIKLLLLFDFEEYEDEKGNINLALIEKCAKENNILAQDELGRIYATGRKNIKQDLGKAKEWWKKAAEQGLGSSQTGLGILYYEENDYHNAKKWFEKAAEQDFTLAQFFLGIMYENGEAVKQDYHKAKDWYGKACDNGNQEGCDAYARLSKEGF